MEVNQSICLASRLEVDLSKGISGTEDKAEQPNVIWRLRGGLGFDPDTGVEDFKLSNMTKGSPLPLEALAPLILLGGAKWLGQDQESPLKVAIQQLPQGGRLEITKRLNFITGDDAEASVGAFIVKSLIRHSKGGLGLTMETDVSIHPSSVKAANSSISADGLMPLKKLHAFDETIQHKILDYKHQLHGDATLWFETVEGLRIKAHMESEWNYMATTSSPIEYRLYKIHREVACEVLSHVEFRVMAVGTAETLFSSLGQR